MNLGKIGLPIDQYCSIRCDIANLIKVIDKIEQYIRSTRDDSNLFNWIVDTKFWGLLLGSPWLVIFDEDNNQVKYLSNVDEVTKYGVLYYVGHCQKSTVWKIDNCGDI